MRADVMSKHPSEALMTGMQNETIMFSPYGQLDSDLLEEQRRRIQERVLHRHRYETERQISMEKKSTKTEMGRPKVLKRYHSLNDIPALDLQYSGMYDDEIHRNGSKYYAESARDAIKHNLYDDEMEYSQSRRNGYPQTSRGLSPDRVSDDTRELYEKLNALRSPTLNFERGPKSTSYTQKYREKTEFERRSNNNSRNTVISSNRSSRNNSSRMRMKTDAQGPNRGIPRQDQVSRDTNSDTSRCSSNQGFVYNSGSRRNSLSPTKNIRSMNTSPNTYEQEFGDGTLEQISEIYHSKDSVKPKKNANRPIKVVLKTGDSSKIPVKSGSRTLDVNNLPSSLIIGHQSAHVENIPSSLVIGHQSAHVENIPSSLVIGHQSAHVENIPSSLVMGHQSAHVENIKASRVKGHQSAHVENIKASRVKGHQSAHVENIKNYTMQSKINQKVQRTFGKSQMSTKESNKVTEEIEPVRRQPAENKTQNHTQRKNDIVKTVPQTVVKQTNHDHSKSEKMVTQTVQREVVGRGPLKNNSSDSMNSQTSKGPGKKLNSTGSIQSNKVYDNDSGEQRIPNGANHTTSLSPGRKPTNKSHLQKDLRANRKYGSTKQKSESDSDGKNKPKKGILRKSNSFKVIGNSNHFFGYMSLNEETDNGKKVNKKVHYKKENGKDARSTSA